MQSQLNILIASHNSLIIVAHKQLIRSFNMAAKRKSTGKTTATNSISALNIGGVKTPCTRKEFDKQIEGKIHSQCDLKDVGTFYFVLGEVAEFDEFKRSDIWLKFYNKEEKVVHTSKIAPIMGPRNKPCTSFAVTQDVFILSGSMLSFDKTWGACHFNTLNSQVKLDMADYLTDQTSIHKTGLARIKETAETDFTLLCDGGQKIEVHRSVMEGLWPFFQGMMSSNMKEVAEKKVKLTMPKTTLEALVRYLYGEKLNLAFGDAANLIVYAQMYELTELLDLATEKVESVNMSITQAIYLWRKSFEAQNEGVREYASETIEKLMPDVEDFDGEIEGLKKAELVSLFSDVALSAKRRKVD